MNGTRGDAEGRDPVDRLLRDSGARLRAEAPPMDGARLLLGRLESKLRRTRRNGFVAVGVAAALLAATVGFVVSDDDAVEMAAGDHGVVAPGSPESILEGLPEAPVDPHDVELVGAVEQFGTCEDLLEELRTVGAAHVGSGGFGSVLGGVQVQGATMSYAGDADVAGISVEPATLGTNVIVEGVDEPDVVKASGRLVVDLSDSKLRVVDTSLGAIVGSLDLVPTGVDRREVQVWPTSLLIDGDRAVVFGTESVRAEPIAGDPSATRPPVEYTTVTLVDLSDPSKPTELDRVRLEGNLVAARMVDGQVRAVIGSTMADVAFVMPSTPASVPVALEQNRLAVAGSSIDDWIPAWDRGEGSDRHRLVPCDRVVVPETFAGVQMTSLVAFDVAGSFEPETTGILAPSDEITATAQDVVVASHIWADPIDQDERYDDWSSALHRFSFSDGAPSYVASGEVPGSIGDEFSISVLDELTVGVLTVDVLPWEQREDAKVTVRTLATTGDRLEPIGSLEIASAQHGTAGMRFVGERLLVSTGPAGDHLSVISLTDPAGPRAEGELELGGSGGYFHPLGDDRILVVGQAWPDVAPELRLLQGQSDLSVSLVDLSTGPVVITSSRVPDTYSNVADDHHGFTWWPARASAAFGVAHGAPEQGSLAPAPDALFVGVQGDSLIPTLVRPSEADLGPRCPPGQVDPTGCDDTFPPTVQRVLVVGGGLWLYTTESLERFDVGTEGPITTAVPAGMVVLPPPGH